MNIDAYSMLAYKPNIACPDEDVDGKAYGRRLCILIIGAVGTIEILMNITSTMSITQPSFDSGLQSVRKQDPLLHADRVGIVKRAVQVEHTVQRVESAVQSAAHRMQHVECGVQVARTKMQMAKLRDDMKQVKVAPPL